ncbi:unnamed protein product [Pleuronectes platessa]|uniref:Uncharacterized protein n=1 Tax=Pleuronectes platessa TaxID=8262 RepID=A0A9N7UU57_PLEPL|nr:unnamed protein product [Pleuronectes platessa]
MSGGWRRWLLGGRGAKGLPVGAPTYNLLPLDGASCQSNVIQCIHCSLNGTGINRGRVPVPREPVVGELDGSSEECTSLPSSSPPPQTTQSSYCYCHDLGGLDAHALARRRTRKEGGREGGGRDGKQTGEIKERSLIQTYLMRAYDGTEEGTFLHHGLHLQDKSRHLQAEDPGVRRGLGTAAALRCQYLHTALAAGNTELCFMLGISGHRGTRPSRVLQTSLPSHSLQLGDPEALLGLMGYVVAPPSSWFYHWFSRGCPPPPSSGSRGKVHPEGGISLHGKLSADGMRGCGFVVVSSRHDSAPGSQTSCDSVAADSGGAGEVRLSGAELLRKFCEGGERELESPQRRCNPGPSATLRQLRAGPVRGSDGAGGAEGEIFSPRWPAPAKQSW